MRTALCLAGGMSAIGGRPNAALPPDLSRVSINGLLPVFSADFARRVYAQTDGDVPITAVGFADLVTFSRASTGDYQDTDGVTRTAATNEPRLDFASGGRGLLVQPESSPRAKDLASIGTYPQQGAALVEFYPCSDNAAGHVLQGLLTIGQGTFGRGVAIGYDRQLDRISINIDDNTNWTLVSLAGVRPGLNRAFIAWDLVAGRVSFAINGGALYDVPELSAWVPVVPDRAFIGVQDIIGGPPREYNGAIASVHIYGAALKAPITRDGATEAAIRKACATPLRATFAHADIDVFGDIYGAIAIAEAASLEVLSEDGGYFALIASTGDYVDENDEPKGKVRAEMQRRPGFRPDATVWSSMEMMLPTLSYTSWAALQQWHQGGTTVDYPGEPPLSLQIPGNKPGQIYAVLYTQNDVEPADADYTELAQLPITAGVWHKIDQYIEWGNGGAGVFKLWVDGVLIVNYSGELGYTRTNFVSFKAGVYRGETQAERDGPAVSRRAEYRNIRVEEYAFPGALS